MTTDERDATIGGFFDDLRPALAFLTRLPPLPFGRMQDRDAPDLGRAARVFPVIGGIVGIVGGAVLLVATWLGESPVLAALLAVAATCLLTGGLHEDGLTDTADGFGGGRSAEQKLAIMDDSRIGAYGALALVFSVLFRVAALSSLAEAGAWSAALGLVAAEAASRAAMVRLWHGLPAARLGGLSESAGSPDDRAMLAALAAAAVIVVVTVVPTFGIMAAIVATIVLGLSAYWFTRL
ncbi:MAG: adenosylcobinamide-GDP ribazoletransferase, partial [Bauldia sp.]